MKIDIKSDMRTIVDRGIQFFSQYKWWILAFFLSIGSVYSTVTYLEYQSVDIAVDMQVDKGRVMHVFINDDIRKSPHALLLQTNKRHTYTIKGISGNINFLRLDPTNRNDAQIEIFGIRVLRKNKEIRNIAPQTIQKWNTVNIQVLQVNPQSIVIKSLSNDPILFVKEPLLLKDGLFPKLGITIEPNDLIWIVLLLGILGMVLLSRKQDMYVVWIPSGMFLLLTILAPFILRWMLGLEGALPSIQFAVGNASYWGVAKVLESNAFFMTVIAAGLIAVLFYFISQHLAWLKNEPLPIIQIPNIPFSHRFIWVTIVVFFVFGFPNIAEKYNHLVNIMQHPQHWDLMNLINWQYQQFMHWAPFRDYWYCYSGNYLLSGPFPGEMFRMHLHATIIFLALLVSLYFLTNKSKRWTLIILFGLLILKGNNFVHVPYRYFMALDVVLLFLAMQRLRQPKFWHYGVFGVFVGYVFFMGTEQLVYAFPAVFAQIVYQFWMRQGGEEKKRFCLFLLSAAATTFLIIGAYFISMLIRDQWDGFLQFFSRLGVQADSGSVRSTIETWYELTWAPKNIVVYASLFFLMTGIYWTLRNVRRLKHSFADVALSIGLLGIMLLQKQIIREGIELQFLGYFFVGSMLLLYAWSLQWTQKQKAIQFFFTLLFISLLGIFQFLDPVFGQYKKQVTQIIPSIGTLFQAKENIEKAKGNYFSSASFSAFPGASDFPEYLKQLAGKTGNEKFYVLGDQSYLYIVSRQKPPYHTNLYNTSDIEDQKRIMSWLEEEEIPFVFWDNSAKGFDAVPHILRVPLIFNYIIQHYQPIEKYSDFQVLRRRQENERLDMNFWTEHLDARIHLRNIPSNTSFDQMPIDASGGKSHEWLQITLQPELRKNDVVLKIKSGEKIFTVLFDAKSNQEVYYIYLNRLWFWQIANQFNLTSQVVDSNNDGIKLELKSRAAQEQFLY